jgi:MFS transporter, DHA2 family, multidrug resistance protein
VLGGWLTEDYNWRWVFFVNIPFGVLASLGIVAVLPETKAKKTPFDMFGFVALSIGIGALQLMLDRGELKDWFSSREIQLEAVVAAVGLYLFVTHMLTAEHPFISRGLFKDRNFVVGNVFIFMVGVVLFATLALLPSLMQGLMGYSVLTAGIVSMPRGIGTWVAMAVVGRITGLIDGRWVIAFGFALGAFSLWQMAGMSPDADERILIVSGIIQGFGTGLAYVSLTVVAFVTLPGSLRNEGAAFFNLMRNVGSSVGISTIQAYVTRGTASAHATLSESITPFTSGAAQAQGLPGFNTVQGLVGINQTVTAQAAWIGYLNAFYLMMILTILVIPLIAFARGAKQPKREQVAVE